MSQLNDIRVALAAACSDVPGLIGYEAAPEDPTYPCAVVGPPTEIDYRRRHATRPKYTFVVTVHANALAAGYPHAARELDDAVDYSGIPSTIDDHDTPAWRTAVVDRAVNGREQLIEDANGNARAVLLSIDLVIEVTVSTDPTT